MGLREDIFDYAKALDAPAFDERGHGLASAVEPYSRFLVTAAAGTATTSQGLRLSYWTATHADEANLYTKITSYTGTTAAGATPTIARMGVYEIHPTTGDGVLIAANANDTTTWGATNTKYQKTLTSSFRPKAGTRYANAALVVTGAALPTWIGALTPAIPLLAELPLTAALLAAQADLPATFLNSGLTQTSFAPFIHLNV